MLKNYIKIAWKVLLRRPFYTFITLFGITFTLTILMVIASFVDHLIGNHYPEVYRDRSVYISRVKQQDSLRVVHPDKPPDVPVPQSICGQPEKCGQGGHCQYV